MDQSSTLFYEFGIFRLDPMGRAITQAGRAVALPPKAFDLLHFLVQNSGQVLEKDEIMKALWAETIVEESNLTQNIFLVRKALDDDGNGNSFIQTIPRRGYKFVVPVKQVKASNPENGLSTVGKPASTPDYWKTHSPFRGLQVFEPEDSWLFFGREAETNDLLTRLARSSTLVVVGDSGSGKSSLVRAGLISAVRQGRCRPDGTNDRPWRIMLVRPSAAPFDYLAEVLPSQLAPELNLSEQAEFIADCRSKLPQGAEALRNAVTTLASARVQTKNQARVLLVVDQFEELFTLTVDRDLHRRYIDSLLTTSQWEGPIPVYLVLVLRADFYSHCLQHPGLSRRLEKNLYNVPRMSHVQLRSAIEKRLTLAGAQAEAGLIDAVLTDVGTEPGDLALLEHALSQLWVKCGGFGCTLTNHAYAAIGRLRGALSTHADQVCDDFANPSQKELAQRIFLELVHLGEGAPDTRRRVRKAELLALNTPEQVEGLLAKLASSRLISISGEGQDSFVEVSHEALIREWSTLREWIKTNGEQLRLERRLIQAAKEWEEVGRDPGALLQGARLAQAEELLAISVNLPSSVSEFLQTSVAARQEAKAKDLQIQQIEFSRHRASVRRFRWFSGGLAGLLIIAVTTAWFVWKQGLIAESRALAARAEATLSQDQPAALSTSIQAWNVAHTAEARLSVIASFPQLITSLQGHTDAIQTMRLSPDGQRILTAGRDGTARLWNADTGQLMLTLSGHSDSVWDVNFSPDGQRIVTASLDHSARVWNASTGQVLSILQGHSGNVLCAVFSPDGKLILTASRDHTARLWDVTGKLLTILQGHSDLVGSTMFSPDGKLILTASWDHTARLWDVTGKLLTILQGHSDLIDSAAFSPDSKLILTASRDHTARLWNVSSGRCLAILRGHSGAVWSAAFSPDGQRIATAGADGVVQLWSPINAQLLATLKGHIGIVERVVFSPDGRHILTASGDQTARIWEAASGDQLAILRGHARAVVSVLFFPDGQRVLTGSLDKTARIWNIMSSTKLVTASRGHSDNILQAVPSPDGQHILTVSNDHTAKVWNAATGQLLLTLQGHSDVVRSAVFSPDGEHILTASDDHTAKVWNAATGQLLLTLQGHSDAVTSAVFSPDGQRILTAGWDHTAKAWNAATGQLLLTLQGHSDIISAVFFPNGQRILTASWDHTAKVWNAATGQPLLTLQGHSGIISRAVCSPNGQRILTASWDHTAKVWNAATGQLLLTLQGHTDRVEGAEFSPDGRLVLTASWDKTARVWDATSGELLTTLEGHLGAIWRAVFSADSQYILTASYDNTARLWNVTNGHLLTIFQGHSDTVWDGEFFPDGQRVVTASADGTARIFRVVRLSEVAELLAN